jgi:hypothetical protein
VLSGILLIVASLPPNAFAHSSNIALYSYAVISPFVYLRQVSYICLLTTALGFQFVNPCPHRSSLPSLRACLMIEEYESGLSPVLAIIVDLCGNRDIPFLNLLDLYS